MANPNPGKRPKPPVIPPERAGKKIVISAAGALLTALVGYYIMLPPLNLKAKELYLYIFVVLASFVLLLFLLSGASSKPEYMPYVRKTVRVPVAIGLAVAVFFGVAWAISSPFFQAKRYSAIMEVKLDASFQEDLPEADFAMIPKLDESSANLVANRALGDLAKYVSQFVIAETNTQINYKEKPVRVVTLGYANLIKWFTNRSEGIPGYVIVDMANEKSELIELDERIKYTDAEHFGRLLKRHLRFQYPTTIFGTPNFEIDDEGKPFWIAPIIDMTIGLLGGEDIVGVVLVDAVTGTHVRYSLEDVRGDESLQWIDRVFSATLLTTQYNYYGKYKDGFWNSILGQSGVTVTTAGYNYIAKEDDVFMYTGITSVAGDQSIIGFILVNQRTKETTFYRVNGATESSAQGAAEGLVSAYKWTATFPLLINVAGEPTYFLTLKEPATGVLQGYSLVNVGQYNKIKVWGKTMGECIDEYVKALAYNGINTDNVEIPDELPDGETGPGGLGSVIGTVADIRSAVISGNTIYYIKLDIDPEASESKDSGDDYYAIAAKDNEMVVLLNVGDLVKITRPQGGAGIMMHSEVTFITAAQ
ncbi:MAG: CvpA family protein [Oscillospiraceae bacterium]|nr:CvpA family protein [Oscillospiraceae bacterium]